MTFPVPDRPLITTLKELDALDLEDVVEGYRSYWSHGLVPGENSTTAFIHGWRCAYWDDNPDRIPEQHRALAHLVVNREKGRWDERLQRGAAHGGERS